MPVRCLTCPSQQILSLRARTIIIPAEQHPRPRITASCREHTGIDSLVHHDRVAEVPVGVVNLPDSLCQQAEAVRHWPEEDERGGRDDVTVRVAGGRLRDYNLRMLFGLSTIAMALSMALIFLLPIGVLPLIALFLVAGTVGAFGWVALTTLLISTTPAPPATTMVFNGAVMNTGSALGALAGGLLLAFGGYGAIGIGLLAFSVVSAMYVWQRDWRIVFAGFHPRPVE